jgi:hypothetical protein
MANVHARVFAITSLVISLLGFYAAFAAEDFRKTFPRDNERKRMPGWVGRWWFILWSLLWSCAGIWALLRQ